MTLNNVNWENSILWDLVSLVLSEGSTCHRGSKSSSVDANLQTQPKCFEKSLSSLCGVVYFHIMCGHKKFTKDVDSIPAAVCEILDEYDNKSWCYHSMLNDVINKQADVKHNYLRKRSVPNMNNKLRKNTHRKSTLRHKYYKWNALWGEYARQRNFVTYLNKCSKAMFFFGGCYNCPKNAKLCPTMKPFVV